MAAPATISSFKQPTPGLTVALLLEARYQQKAKWEPTLSKLTQLTETNTIPSLRERIIKCVESRINRFSEPLPTLNNPDRVIFPLDGTTYISLLKGWKEKASESTQGLEWLFNNETTPEKDQFMQILEARTGSRVATKLRERLAALRTSAGFESVAFKTFWISQKELPHDYKQDKAIVVEYWMDKNAITRDLAANYSSAPRPMATLTERLNQKQKTREAWQSAFIKNQVTIVIRLTELIEKTILNSFNIHINNPYLKTPTSESTLMLNFGFDLIGEHCIRKWANLLIEFEPFSTFFADMDFIEEKSDLSQCPDISYFRQLTREIGRKIKLKLQSNLEKLSETKELKEFRAEVIWGEDDQMTEFRTHTLCVKTWITQE
jgi:hypothetical protein